MKKAIKKKLDKEEKFPLVAARCSECGWKKKGIAGNATTCLGVECKRTDSQKLPKPSHDYQRYPNNWECTHEITGDERQRMVDEARTIDDDLRKKDNERRKKKRSRGSV